MIKVVSVSLADKWTVTYVVGDSLTTHRQTFSTKAAANAWASKHGFLSLDYTEVKKRFKDGDWVVGIGEHIGMSQVFDCDTDHPQPFSYLDDNDPANFRLASQSEIDEHES